MAGTIIADKIQTENAFLTLNVGQTLVATINSSGILNSSGGTMIGANGSVSNTAITGLVTASQIATVANTQITGNITSSQITSNPTLYGNVSVTGVIGVGGATTSTSGSGISFPATQSASADANTLDDYEEGTWTPTVTSGTGSITTVVVAGWYRKVGGLVSLQFTYQITNNGTGASTVNIAGLPFTNSIGANVSAGVMREIAVNGQTGTIYFNSATTLSAVNYVSAYPGGANHYWVGSICYYAA